MMKPFSSSSFVVVIAVIIHINAIIISTSAAPIVDNNGNGNGIGKLGVTNMMFPDSITPEALAAHYDELQAIADSNGGSRSVATGYNDSAAYIVRQLGENTNFLVTTDYLTVSVWTELTPPTLVQTTPNTINFQRSIDFASLRYGGFGSKSIIDTPVEYIANGGCSSSDWSNFNPSSIALVSTGMGCELFEKSFFAEDAGAAALLIHQTFGSSGMPTGRVRDVYWVYGDRNTEIPVLAVSQTTAQVLSGNGDSSSSRVSLTFNADLSFYYTFNVIADTPNGDEDNTVTIGAHLDSVPEGPGLNDNGSGSISILEIAIQFYRQGIIPINRIRFCWWGAEEIGLLGSRSYLRNLNATNPQEFSRIVLNINHDMLGSPNGQVNVHNGNDAPEALRDRSLNIQSIYEEYYNANNIKYTITAMLSGSDFLPFLENGIPAGGLNTGASGIKTAAERTVYGGLANAAYDPAYHLAEDTVANPSLPITVNCARGAAYVTSVLATSDLCELGVKNC